MEDDFLEAAILNWDDVKPPPVVSTTTFAPTPQARVFEPFVILGVLYALAMLVVGYRWLVMRSR